MGPVFYFSRKGGGGMEGGGGSFVIRNRKRATGLLCADQNAHGVGRFSFPEIHPLLQNCYRIVTFLLEKK